MIEELKNAKEEIKYLNEKETMENPKLESSDEFSCKICDLYFSSKTKMKVHNQSDHTPHIKCESCEESFAKNCDLESHIKRSHDQVENFECNKCG